MQRQVRGVSSTALLAWRAKPLASCSLALCSFLFALWLLALWLFGSLRSFPRKTRHCLLLRTSYTRRHSALSDPTSSRIPVFEQGNKQACACSPSTPRLLGLAPSRPRLRQTPFRLFCPTVLSPWSRPCYWHTAHCPARHGRRRPRRAARRRRAALWRRLGQPRQGP